MNKNLIVGCLVLIFEVVGKVRGRVRTGKRPAGKHEDGLFVVRRRGD